MAIQAALGRSAAPHGSPRSARDDDAAWSRTIRSRLRILMALFVASFSAGAEAAPRGRHIHPRSFLFDPFDDGFYGPVIPELPPPLRRKLVSYLLA